MRCGGVTVVVTRVFEHARVPELLKRQLHVEVFRRLRRVRLHAPDEVRIARAEEVDQPTELLGEHHTDGGLAARL